MHELMLLSLVAFFAAITPGPDSILVLRSTLIFGAKQSLKVLFGIATGWLFYFALISAGLSYILNIPFIQLFLSFAGGLYLLYLAYNLLVLPPSNDDIKFHNTQKDGYLRGLIVNLSNPKAIIFFIFLLTPFLSFPHGIFWSFIVLWCSLFATFCFIIIIASIARKYICAKYFYYVDKICGGLFGIFAWWLLFEAGKIIGTLLRC